jgi:hypothetical protein
MPSKDHFSNVLNPVAGQVARATVRFAVAHMVDSWSDEGKDIRQVIDAISFRFSTTQHSVTKAE